jgi:hypothetical protein
MPTVNKVKRGSKAVHGQQRARQKRARRAALKASKR